MNLGGKCILPGINDSHGHAVWLAATNPPLALNLRYPAISSIREAAALLERIASSFDEWARRHDETAERNQWTY